MIGRNHLKIGLSVALPTLNPVIIASSVVGSILPDIDTHNSLVSQLTLFGGFPFCNLKHRGPTHSLLASALVSLVSFVAFKNIDISLGVGLGYLSHLFADMLTVQGIQLLYPCDFKLKFGTNLKTGHKAEDIVANIILIACALLSIKVSGIL